MIKRELENLISKRVESGKAVVLLGARQTGKTTLLRDLFPPDSKTLWLNADSPDVPALFRDVSVARLNAIFAGKECVVIDEAQRIPDIGVRLKLITDEIPAIKLVVTGSSSFTLANKINEPLTGRKWEYRLYPFSFSELVQEFGLLEEERMIPYRLVYGNYPEVVTHPEDARELLKQLADSYLYKDVLLWERIQKPEAVQRLLQALAFQIGSQVSFQELSDTAGLDRKTVEHYVQILEQAFVIFRLPSFSRNLRNELKKSRKIYFWDNGIRNAVIPNFAELETRSPKEIGALWENWLVSQRMIRNQYRCRDVRSWFWRTKAQNEIDYLEVADGNLQAWEFEWSSHAKSKGCQAFQKAYQSEPAVVNRENVAEFLS